MWRPGILLSEGIGNLPVSRLAAKAKAAGFDEAAFVCTEKTPVAALASAARTAGLSLSAAVAAGYDMAAVWRAGDEGDAVIAELANLAETAGRAEVPLLILPAAGSASVSQCGIDRYRRLGAFAAGHGVALALRDTEDPRLSEVLFAILDPPHGAAVGCLPRDGANVSRAAAVLCEDGIPALPDGLRHLPVLPFFAAPDLSGREVVSAFADLYEEERRLFRAGGTR